MPKIEAIMDLIAGEGGGEGGAVATAPHMQIKISPQK
jgi:hypothetical protein